MDENGNILKGNPTLLRINKNHGNKMKCFFFQNAFLSCWLFTDLLLTQDFNFCREEVHTMEGALATASSLSAGYTSKWPFHLNSKHSDKPLDLRVTYFQTNPILNGGYNIYIYCIYIYLVYIYIYYMYTLYIYIYIILYI